MPVHSSVLKTYVLISNIVNIDSLNLHKQKLFGILNNFLGVKGS